MPLLNPTPRDRLVDPRGRPYFLWDEDITLERFEERLRDPDLDIRAYYAAKLLRQAKPDDVFCFLSLEAIDILWPRLERYLGRKRRFWAWLLDWWRANGGR